MGHRNIWRNLALPVICGILLLLWLGQGKPMEVPAIAGGAGVEEDSPSLMETYDTTRESNGMRVTILSITKGIAFRETQELIVGAGAPHGTNVVPWLRLEILVEGFTDNVFGPANCLFETADGRNLLEPIVIQSHGHSVLSRGSGSAVMDLDFPRPDHDPITTPVVDRPDESKIVYLYLAGNFRSADRANLTLTIGKEQRQAKFVFLELPIP